MTHGDKAKAKTVKASSKTSGQKSSHPGKTVGKTSPKTSTQAKSSGQTGKKGIAASQKAGSGQKGTAPKAAVKGGPPAKGKPAKADAGKGVPAKGSPPKAAADGIAISNGIIAASFKRAIKKYPNAFRKLTD